MSVPGSPFHGTLRQREAHSTQITLSESALGSNTNHPQDNIITKRRSNDQSSIAINGGLPKYNERNNCNDIKLIPAKRRILSFDERRTHSLPHHYKATQSELLSKYASFDITDERETSNTSKINPLEFKKRLDTMKD